MCEQFLDTKRQYKNNDNVDIFIANIENAWLLITMRPRHDRDQ